MYLLDKHESHRLCVRWFTQPALASPSFYTGTLGLALWVLGLQGSASAAAEGHCFAALTLGLVFMALARDQCSRMGTGF